VFRFGAVLVKIQTAPVAFWQVHLPDLSG
jgi:hypothetical protein